jgi:predicted nuclease of predicted toxin-antitoxin system
MRVLLDHNLPRKLRFYLAPHEAVLTRDEGWNDLGNGQLLTAAQPTCDVLLTTDTNIYHQQKVAQFDIAVIVLRAYNNKVESLLPLMLDVLRQMETIEPGRVYYIYADERLKESDRRKGKGSADK